MMDAPLAYPGRSGATFGALVFALEVLIFKLVDTLLERLHAAWLRYVVAAAFALAVGWELHALVTAARAAPAGGGGAAGTPARSAQRRVGGGGVSGGSATPARRAQLDSARRALHRSPEFEAAAGGAPVDAQLQPRIAGLLGETPWTLRYAELPGAATYEQVRTVLAHPFERVVAGLAAKYNLHPDPARSAADARQPPVHALARLSDAQLHVRPPLGDGSDSGGAPEVAVRLTRERASLGLPALVARLSGEGELELLMDYEAQPARRRLFMWTRNASLTAVGRFQEWALYRPLPGDPDGATEYVSVVQVAASTWVGGRILALVGGTGAGMIRLHVELLRVRLDELAAAAAAAAAAARSSSCSGGGGGGRSGPSTPATGSGRAAAAAARGSASTTPCR